MWLAIGCSCLGLLLIYIEFFTPGGVIGVLGGVALFCGGILFVRRQPYALPIITYVVVILILLVLTIKLALWTIQHSKYRKTIYADQNQEGFIAATYEEEVIGREGIADTNLKPAGYIIIDQKRFQVISQGGYVKKGSCVRVLGGTGAHLFVYKERD